MPLLRVGFAKDHAENDVPQPQPPVAFGFSNVKPEPIIFVVWSIVMPFRYWAENISTKSRSEERRVGKECRL